MSSQTKEVKVGRGLKKRTEEFGSFKTYLIWTKELLTEEILYVTSLKPVITEYTVRGSVTIENILIGTEGKLVEEI